MSRGIGLRFVVVFFYAYLGEDASKETPITVADFGYQVN